MSDLKIDLDTQAVVAAYREISGPLNECVDQDERNKWLVGLGYFTKGWEARMKQEQDEKNER